MTFDVVPKLVITAIGMGLAGYVGSGKYSQPDASYRQMEPVRRFLEAALAGDFTRLAATAEAQPIDWVRHAIRIDSAAVREWAESRPYVSSIRRGDSLWVTLRRFGSTARCSPLFPLTAAFVSQGNNLRLVHLTSSCPSVSRTSPLRPTNAAPRKVAVLSIALNDVSNQPASPELPDRMRWLGTSLRERLGAQCGYQVIQVGTTGAAAESRAGYLSGQPDLAAEVGGAAGAEWVVVPRLNRASPWVTDLQANVIRVRDTLLVSNRIVELKGIELSPELAAQLVERGAAWMADQLSQAIEHAAGATGRRCPP